MTIYCQTTRTKQGHVEGTSSSHSDVKHQESWGTGCLSCITCCDCPTTEPTWRRSELRTHLAEDSH